MKRKLLDVERKHLEEIAADLYNDLGPDLGWVDRQPTKEEFVSVISDRMLDRISQEKDSTHYRNLWLVDLSRFEKRSIVLSAY